MPLSKNTLAVAAGRKLHFWTGGGRACARSCLDTFTCVGEHEGAIWDMALTADRSALVTGSSDGLVKVWPLARNADAVALAAAQPAVLSSNHDDIYSIAVGSARRLQRRSTRCCPTSCSAAASTVPSRSGTASSASACRWRRADPTAME